MFRVPLSGWGATDRRLYAGNSMEIAPPFLVIGDSLIDSSLIIYDDYRTMYAIL
ncbi:MAG: hypothetical protein LBB47_08010 [Spirochaetaceae bacterium]|nr:hypothetical protein [Spirochaetaceae bacterium]